MRLSDDELHAAVKGCIKGDRQSQKLLFQCFYGKMMAVCMRYTRDRDTAQDIVQDGFIKVFDKVKDFGFNGSFEGWVRRIMVNQAIDYVRKSKVSFELIDNLTADEGDDNPDADAGEPGDEAVLTGDEYMEQIYNAVSPDVILEAMEHLSPAYKAVFNLYAIENYSHQEIAESLGISIGTSKSNYAKAKLNLKKILMKKLNIKEPR